MTKFSRHSSKPSLCKQCGWWQEWQKHGSIWGKVFKSGLSNFFKGCLPQSLLSRLLNSLSHILCLGIFICYVIKAYPSSCQNLVWKESPFQIVASTLLRSTTWCHNIEHFLMNYFLCFFRRELVNIRWDLSENMTSNLLFGSYPTNATLLFRLHPLFQYCFWWGSISWSWAIHWLTHDQVQGKT